MSIAKLDATIPKRQPRPVRFMFTPTGLHFGSQFPFVSIAHQAVVVGDPNSRDGVLTSELRRIDRNDVEQQTIFPATLAPATVEELKKATIIGYTQKTDGEIFHAGKPMSLL
jgi:hypothetical protein